jgi:hypothetical protein
MILTVGDTVQSTLTATYSLTILVQRPGLTDSSYVQATAEKEGRGGVSHRLLAGWGVSRRPQGAINPARARVRWNEVLGDCRTLDLNLGISFPLPKNFDCDLAVP